jgi:hypothetical protein
MKVMVDCGAFSAKRGVAISLRDYIAFCQANAAYFGVCVSLDLIPPDQYGTEEEIDAYAAQSYHNWQVMKNAGLHPMPTFHQGESFARLEAYLAAGEAYIGISPFRKDQVRALLWVGDCFAIIGNSARVHGFGLMSDAFIRRFPWYSVDSSTWCKRGAYGQIPIPHQGADDSLDYLHPDYVAITDGSRHHQQLHLSYLPPSQLDFICRYLEETVGIDLAEAQGKPSARWRCGAVFLKEVERQTNIKVYFVTDTTRAQAKVLNECSVEYRLISYVRLRNKPDALKRYCK